MAQERLGPYRLLKEIRAGKTCVVWEAINDASGERYALKVLSDEHASNREEVGFLKHEALVAKGMDHPNVIKLHEFVSKRDYAYLAMELFPVPNLKQLIVQGIDALQPIAPTIIQSAGEGLAYFHSQGWVHRDVKPDNFLVKPDGESKLIDFALAVKRKGGLSRLFSVKTRIQGTRSYMSPEQIRGQALDERADLYSFGCVIYELLGGKPPYTGSTTNELLNKHLKSAIPPLGASNRNIHDDFAQLARRLLAKKPEDRPDSMNDFLRDLRAMAVFKVPPAPVR